MGLRIGEVTSSVTVEGMPQDGAASSAKAPPPWERLQKHRRLTELSQEDARRTAEEGFDG